MVNAPVISGLSISPSAAYVSELPQNFSTQSDFSDPDGNLAELTLKVLDGNGATIDLQTLPIEGVDGLTTGTILGQVTPGTAIPDTYTAEIYVTDATGLKSNTLAGNVRIAAYPWTTRPSDPIPREYAASAVLDDKVYVMGGQRTDGGVVPGPVTNLMEIYDPSSKAWSTATPMPTARMGLVAAVIKGRIYAMGGSTDGHSTSAVGTVEVFDPGTNLWTTRNPMPTARGQLAMAEANGRQYAIGGYGGLVSQWLGTVEEYNPLTDTWAVRASMPTVRAHLALAQIDGKLLAAGGENLSRALDLLELYDPVANVWLTKTPGTTTFTRATSVAVNGNMLVFGNSLSLAYDPANEIR
ncbi:MAG: hypothetical protein K9J76_01185 [Polaromonas sp.]|nr:hypothetical protein [Polaromonas sp.]